MKSNRSIELDCWRIADMLVKQHGEDAAIHAGMKHDKFLADGNLEGMAVWKQVLRAIVDLQRGTRNPGEPLN